MATDVGDVITSKRNEFLWKNGKIKRKSILVLDLDNTLVYSQELNSHNKSQTNPNISSVKPNKNPTNFQIFLSWPR